MNFDREIRRFRENRRTVVAGEINSTNEFTDIVKAINDLKPQLDKITTLVNSHYDELKTHLKSSDKVLYNNAEKSMREFYHDYGDEMKDKLWSDDLAEVILGRVANEVVNAMSDELTAAWGRYDEEKTEDDNI